MRTKLKLFLFCFMSFPFVHSQTETITGKLNLLDLENSDIVLNNMYIILVSESMRDSIKLDNDFSFHFKNLPSDTFCIFCSLRSYPYDTRYMAFLREGENKNVHIEYSSTCPYDKKSDSICPVCKRTDEVIPIHYGLIAEVIGKGKKPTKRKYYPGGCIIFDCQASWYCERDKKEF